MKIIKEWHRDVRAYLTAFQGIILGIALVFSLTACDSRQLVQTTQTIDIASTALPSALVTQQPTSVGTSRPSRYVTRTPVSTTPAATSTAVKELGIRAEQLEGLQIHFWHVWSGQAGRVMQEIIDAYNRSNPWKVRVEVRVFDSFASLEDSFTNAQAMDDPPDLLVASDDRARHWDLGGQTLVDLQPYVTDSTWGMSAAEQADFYPRFWQQGIAYGNDSYGNGNGQISVPLQRSELVIYYNQTWAVELGYRQAPDTLSKLRSQACAAARIQGETGEDDVGGLMLSILPTSTPGRGIILYPEQLFGWIGTAGGQIYLADGKGYQFNTPEVSSAFEFLKDLQQEKCMYLNDSSTPADDFAGRQALLYVASTADLPTMRAAFQTAGSQDEWAILPFPTVNGELSVVAYGPSLIIPQTSPEEQVAAWTLLEWLVDPSNQARWVEAAGAYPTRISTVNLLQDAAAADPVWRSGLELLASAQTELSHPSWSVVRWVVGDALMELFSPTFTFENIPSLLEDLNQLASEIYAQVR